MSPYKTKILTHFNILHLFVAGEKQLARLIVAVKKKKFGTFSILHVFVIHKLLGGGDHAH